MPIDPQAKIARAERRAQRKKDQRFVAKVARKKAQIDQRPLGKITEVVMRDRPSEMVPAEPVEVLPAPLAPAVTAVVVRDPRALAERVQRARETFQENAGRYVEIHKEVAEAALKSGDPKSLEVARRASEFTIAKVSARDPSGTVERIVEQHESPAPSIKIGIALAGIPREKET